MSRKFDDDRFWCSEEFQVGPEPDPDDGFSLTIPVPRGYWIDRIITRAGSTNVGGSAILKASLVEDNNATIITFDADAAGPTIYAPTIPITGSDSTAETTSPGVAIRCYTDQGIRFDLSGTVTTGGSVLVSIRAVGYYPYGYH